MPPENCHHLAVMWMSVLVGVCCLDTNTQLGRGTSSDGLGPTNISLQPPETFTLLLNELILWGHRDGIHVTYEKNVNIEGRGYILL